MKKTTQILCLVELPWFLCMCILDGQHHLRNEISSHCFSASPAFRAVSPALIISTGVPFTQCHQEKLVANTVSHPNPDYLLIPNVI